MTTLDDYTTEPAMPFRGKPPQGEPVTNDPLFCHIELRLGSHRVPRNRGYWTNLVDARKRTADRQGANHTPTRGQIDDRLRSEERCVAKGVSITLETLTELLELLRTKTNHFHIEVDALLKTIYSERDAQKTKP